MPISDDQRHEFNPDQTPDMLRLFPESDDEAADDEDVWSGEDLERAYQEAMSALDDLEQELATAEGVFGGEDDQDPPHDSVRSFDDFPPAAGDVSQSDKTRGDGDAPLDGQTPLLPRLLPAQIIEAALFVGGMPLTVKRLAGVLRDEFDRDFIERTIDDLNLRYDDENRPYEIRLEEGGYRMVLRPEFETVRNRSYGFGPKEVRLSQDVLEVLALVAYRQPITKEEIEQAGKPRPNGALRQLLRREIVALERTGKSAGDVRYRTSPRFLQIFGLADLSELPRAEDLTFK